MPNGLAIDSATGRIFWSHVPNLISYANLDGSGGGGDLNLFGDQEHSNRDRCRPSQGGSTGQTAAVGQPFRSLISRTGGGDLNTAGASLNGPYGVAIDLNAGRIYWSSTSNSISFARLDGSGGADLNTAGATLDKPEGSRSTRSPTGSTGSTTMPADRARSRSRA